MRLLPYRTMYGRRPRWALWRWQDIWSEREICMTRLTVFRCPWFQVLLHWIEKPDPEEALHDHPWWYFGLVLWGEYIEQRAWKTGYGITWPVLQTIRFLIWCPLGRVHRIRKLWKRTITLLVTGPEKQDWGFYQYDTMGNVTKSGLLAYFTPWRDFVETP